MADISKIKLANGTIVTIKDAQGRADVTTLLGGHDLGALGAAAWQAMAASISDAGIADAATVKAYVDAQIKTIPEFDVVIVADGEELPTASAATFHKIYLVKASATGIAQNIYKEYITVKNGDTYSWELVRDTAIDVSDKVDKTTTIAGIALDKDITVAQLQTALKMGAMAKADTASGSDTIETIDSIEMKPVTVAGDATVTYTPVQATLAKRNFTPSGKILVDGKEQTGDGAVKAIKGGSISVSVKDADTATAASLVTEAYKPAGSVVAKADGGSFSALKSASFVQADDGDITISGTISKPGVSLTKSEQNVVATVATAGTLPTYKHEGFDGGKLSAATKSNFATDGVTASVGSGEDAETLIFTSATKSQAVTEQGTFTAAVYGTDTFTQGAMPTFTTSTVNNVTAAALDAVPQFTSKSYKLNTTSDTALKDVEFKGTEVADFRVTGVNYLKQEIDTATFTPVETTISFNGTEVENALVTGVTYDKADATAAFSETVTPETKTLTRTAKTVSITVTPDAKSST